MTELRKRTPKDTTEFERDQLRFLLAEGNVAAVLAEVNPSLAWLPLLAERELIDADTQLAPWIERNFADADAIREVAANMHFFRPKTADFLEFRLARTKGLPVLLEKCWRLIIRHMRGTTRDALRHGWFDIADRIKRREHSQELLERLANILRPTLRVGKKLHWDGQDGREPERPSDLISIDFEIEEGVNGERVLAAWPEDATAELDDKLLNLLTDALSAALEEAMEAGVESDTGLSLSDMDVPSVAQHEQNAYRTGFLPIVRVMADLWTRLARKDSQRALAQFSRWEASPRRLVRRLAAFAAADSTVPPNRAARVLITLPAEDLFLTGSTVEVYRLIDARWSDFAPEEQRAIEKRIVEGPPPDRFREDREGNVDRCRFDLLGHLERSEIRLSAEAQAVLADIRNRWPQWRLRSKERAGFHYWLESTSGVVGDPAKLSDIPDDQLVTAAKRVAASAGLREGDAWEALCQSDVPRALRGLEARAAAGEWPTWAWRPFLWAAPKQTNADDAKAIARLLLEWPEADFSEITGDASWWLNETAGIIDEELLWPIWDRLAEVSIHETKAAHMEDALTESMNHPAGRLAEVLRKKLMAGAEKGEPSESLRTRLEKLITAKGDFGRLARVRLAVEVSLLFERAPEWTKEKIVPLFDWSSPEAHAAWSALRYARYIGSPDLFRLMKKSFLQLFGRIDVPDEELRIFTDWLTAIMIANQSEAADYPVSPTEARSALRQAGAKSLSSVGHRLALEMERAKADEKTSKWREVVGPVFQSIWPLDVELQTSASTFKLVEILCASGAAFPEAAEVIMPFIRPDEPQHQMSIYMLSEADDVLFSSSPERMLDLVAAVVEEAQAQNAFGLGKALDRIRGHAPQLANTKKFQKLIRASGST